MPTDETTLADRVREAREAVIASGKYTVTVGPWNVNIPGPRYGVWSTDENREVFSCAMASQVSAWLMRTEEQHCTDDEMAALLSLSRAESAAEIAALRADGERLDWLDVSGESLFWDARLGWHATNSDGEEMAGPDGKVRAAIDAARAAETRGSNG